MTSLPRQAGTKTAGAILRERLTTPPDPKAPTWPAAIWYHFRCGVTLSHAYAPFPAPGQVTPSEGFFLSSNTDFSFRVTMSIFKSENSREKRYVMFHSRQNAKKGVGLRIQPCRIDAWVSGVVGPHTSVSGAAELGLHFRYGSVSGGLAEVFPHQADRIREAHVLQDDGHVDCGIRDRSEIRVGLSFEVD
jgi:hypothetical protein